MANTANGWDLGSSLRFVSFHSDLLEALWPKGRSMTSVLLRSDEPECRRHCYIGSVKWAMTVVACSNIHERNLRIVYVSKVRLQAIRGFGIWIQ